MKNQLSIILLSAIIISGLFTSCGSIEVTKRRHMPGYHVELNKNKQQPMPDRERAQAEVQPATSAQDMDAMAIRTSTVESPASTEEMPRPVAVAAVSEVIPAKRQAPLQQVLPSVYHETLKVGSALRRAVFAEEGDEKYGWSVIAFIAFGLGVIAFVLMFVGLVSMIAFGPLWFIPAIVGLFFGIGALITGAIGLKKTKRGGKRGRGFALAGMIAGILGLVISLVVLAVGAFRTFLDNN